MLFDDLLGLKNDKYLFDNSVEGWAYNNQGLVINMEDSIVFDAGNGERGKQAQKYKKVKVLGEGSMGRAYLVESAEDQKLYVMKRINIGHLGPKQKQTALREAQLHSMFNHPNIVELKEVYQTTGEKICIIMEYAEGGDLQQFLQEQNGKLLSQSVILNMFVQMCLGLQEVHSKRIIHRDIKTANIFLNKDNVLKIGDFGISKALDKTSLAATAMIGTPYYLSPQMVEGKSYSTKADIWALGVILYQLCALKLPFDATSLPVLALKILKGSFPPIPSNYSKDIKSLILQMLHVDQKKRPSIEAILLKPFLSKYLSKQDKNKLVEKQEQKKQAVKDKQKKMEENKTMAIDKAKQQKNRARKQKQDKREQMRRQMRQDLKKKRAQKQTSESQTNFGTGLTVPDTKVIPRKSPAKNTIKQKVQTPKPQVTSKSIKQIPRQEKQKKQEPVKPWKNRKAGEKKDVTIQMFVPQLKPKNQAKNYETLPPKSDFKVEIFVSKKPQVQSATDFNIEENQREGRKTLPTLQPVTNYHYSDKNIKDEMDDIDEDKSLEQYEQQYEEEGTESDYDIEQILDNIKTVNQQMDKLPDPSKSICLYEQSQNFDSTVQVNPQPKAQDVDNLQHLINSQSLQELRFILEDKLGDEKFMQSYTVVKKHLDDYYQLLMQHGDEIDRQTLRQKYVFNKEYLHQKLSFLSKEQFQKNIELLYTLIMYEDLETQKNQNDGLGAARESKYSRLF